MKQVEDFARMHLGNHDGGHDWWHLERVRNNAFEIMEAEGKGDPVIVEIAALLHDTGDSKFRRKDDPDIEELLGAFLTRLGLGKDAVSEVIFINRNLSFSKGTKPEASSDEFMIVQDADRLDAIGAIGIARAFNYGGFVNNPIFDPLGSAPSTIGHFYDKLLRLKDLMNTESARAIALERHNFLELFLEQFFYEWESSAMAGDHSL